MHTLSENLKKLMKHHAISESELARATGIGQPVIHRIASGETDNPKIASLCPIALFFKISVDQLVGLVGLDFDNLTAYRAPMQSVPLLAWNEISDWLASPRAITPQIHIHTDANVGKNSYALRVQDTTMQPRFPEDTLIIVDPDASMLDQDFIIVELQHAPVFKQILFDGANAYLKSLNSEFPNHEFIIGQHRFLGVLVQARMDFK